MLISLLLWTSAAWAAPSVSTPLPSIDPLLVRQVATCHVRGKAASKQIFLFKQWHLPPGPQTTDVAASMKLPQYVNQKALYEQLDQWISKGEISSLLAEGCPWPRTINSKSPEKFNGWSMAALAGKTGSPDYADVLTNLAYKMKAKWGSRLRVQCGDNAPAIHQELLAFSDSRGIIGYMSRLEQYRKDPRRASGYLEDVIRLYHMKKTATVDQAIHRLNRELKKTVDHILKWNDLRSAKLADAILADPSSRIAVVFGGAHADLVRELLEKKGIACSVYEPAEGYQDDESEMIHELKDLVRQRSGSAHP